MKKNIIMISVIALVVFLFIFFPPRKFSKGDRYRLLRQYAHVCKGLYIETFNETAIDGERGGLCFGKVEKIENLKNTCPDGFDQNKFWCTKNK